MNTNQPISAADAAKALCALVPEAATVRLLPQVSDGGGEMRHWTWTSFYTAGDSWIDSVSAELSTSVLWMLRQVPGRDIMRPQVFDVAAAEWRPMPVAPPVALWDSPLAGWAPNGGHDADCAYVGWVGPCSCSAPDAGALLEQRHQVEDPAEPPLAVAADYAASVAAGYVQQPAWGDADDDADCEPVFAPARDTVPVVGGAL